MIEYFFRIFKFSVSFVATLLEYPFLSNELSQLKNVYLHAIKSLIAWKPT